MKVIIAVILFLSSWWSRYFPLHNWTLWSPCKVIHKQVPPPVTDPGFPRGGGANFQGGAPTYDFAIFSRKLHKIERIWAPRVARIPRAPPLDLPLTTTIFLHVNEEHLNLFVSKNNKNNSIAMNISQM